MGEWFTSVDWDSVFVPSMPLLEIFVRGTVIYLGLFLLLRVILKRQTGAVSTSDLLVIVLIADAAQNAMAADYRSLPDGLLLISTLIFWNIALEWLDFHVPWIGKWLHPAPLPLIKNGRLLHDNMRHELITKDELMSHLREQGIDKIGDVKTAFLEGDGRISVIQRKTKHHAEREEVV